MKVRIYFDVNPETGYGFACGLETSLSSTPPLSPPMSGYRRYFVEVDVDGPPDPVQVVPGPVEEVPRGEG